MFSHIIGNVMVRGLQFDVTIPDGDPDEKVVEKFGEVSFWHPSYKNIGLWDNEFTVEIENHPLYNKYLKPQYDNI